MKLRRYWRLIRSELRLYVKLFRDNRTPLISKVIMILTLLYLISPIDIIPDFIPFAGFVDELIIIPFLLFLSLKFVPIDLIDEIRSNKKSLQRNFKDFQEGVVVD